MHVMIITLSQFENERDVTSSNSAFYVKQGCKGRDFSVCGKVRARLSQTLLEYWHVL